MRRERRFSLTGGAATTVSAEPSRGCRWRNRGTGDLTRHGTSVNEGKPETRRCGPTCVENDLNEREAYFFLIPFPACHSRRRGGRAIRFRWSTAFRSASRPPDQKLARNRDRRCRDYQRLIFPLSYRPFTAALRLLAVLADGCCFHWCELAE